MNALKTGLAKLDGWLKAVDYHDDDQKQLAINLQQMALVGIFACFLTAFIYAFVTPQPDTVQTMLVAIPFACSAVWLARRKQLDLASLVFLLTFLGIVTHELYLADGLHSVGTIVYPVLVVLSSAILSRRWLFFYVGLTIFSVGFILYSESLGWIVHRNAELSLLGSFLIYSLVFGAAAVIVYRLRQSLRNVLFETRQKERRLAFQSAMLDHVGQAVIACAEDDTIIYWNKAATAYYGWNADDVTGKKYTDILHMMNAPEMLAAIDATLHKGQVWSGELDVQKRDHTFLPTISTLAPLRDSKGSMTGWVGIAADITERKQTEEALRESEAFRKRIFDSMRIPIVVMDAVTFQYADCNSAAVQIYAFSSRDEILGKTPLDVSAPVQYDGTPSAEKSRFYTEKALAEGAVVFEWRHQRPGGEIWDAEVHLMSFQSDQRQFLQFTLQDITERKRTEEALRASIAKFETLFQVSPLATVLLDAQGDVQLWNPAAEQIFGWTAQEVVGYPNPIVPPGKQGEYASLSAQVTDGKPLANLETVRQRKDGSLVDVSISSVPIYDGAGNVAGRMAIFADISGRKRTETALRQSEELFSLFMQYSPIYTFIKEVSPVESRVLRASENFREMIGIPGSEMAGKTMEELFPAEFAAKIAADDWVVVSDGHVLKLDEDLNGRNYTTIKFPIVQGGKTLLAGFTIDITDRKQTEAALRTSEERYRGLIEASPVGMWINQGGFIIYVNPAALQMLGATSLDQVVGKRSLDFIHPDYHAAVEDRVQRLSKQGQFSPPLQERYIRLDGSLIDVEVTAVPYFLDEEPIVQVFFQNITERKQTELREARSRELMEKVIQWGKVLTQTASLQQCYTEIRRGVCVGLGFDRAGLFLYDEETRAVQGVIGTDRLGQVEDISDETFVADEGTAWRGTLDSSFGIYYVDDYRSAYVRQDADMSGVQQHVTVSAWAGEKPIAFLAVDNLITQRPICMEEIEALQLFAGYVGLAIQKARWNDELEQRVEDRTNQLEFANRELESLSYTIGHDLRSPIRATVAYSHLLLDELSGQLEASQEEKLRVVNQVSLRMGHMVDDFLTFLRLSRSPLQKIEVNIEKLTEKVIGELKKEQPAGRKINFLVSPMPVCMADANMLRDVFFHLLSNAIKFTSTKDQAQIEVGVTRQQGETCYFVRDNGVGFDMKYSGKLFGVFQRLHRDDEFDGIGVNLAIVSRIIQMHGGRIWAEAEVDKGAAFYFTLEKA